MSKTIDKRVVEMGFDNSNFEKNVQTSMSTLDKLKKSLNFNGLSKGLQDVDKAAKGMSFDKLVTGVESLQKHFSVFGIVGDQVIRRLTNSFMDFTGKMTSFVSSGIIQGGIKRAMNLEQANFMLQGLLNDADAVNAIMKNVSDSVDGTAYSLDAAAKTAAQFAATGMRAGDQMYGALRAVAGVAAMTNSEYEDIGRIFTQVSGQGRLMGDQLLQLSTRGINAASTLTAYMNKMGITANATEADIRDMVSKGKISFDLFAAAMDDAFGEHAKKANETFTGALSNIKSALARIGAEFVSPLIKQNGALVQLFNTIRVKINDVKAAIVPFAKSTTDAIIRLADSLNFFIRTLDLTPTFKVISNVFGGMLNIFKAIGSILAPIGRAFAEVFPRTFIGDLIKVTGSFKDFTAGLSLTFEQSLKVQSVFKAIFTVLGDIANVVGPVVGAGFRALGYILKNLGTIIVNVSGFIGKNANAFISWAKSADILSKAFELLKGALKSVSGKLREWYNEFMEIPQVQRVVKAFSDLFTGVMGNFGTVFDDAKKHVKTFIDKLKDIQNFKFSDVINLFKGIRESAVENFGPTVTKTFENFKSVFSSIRESAKGGVKVIISLFDSLKDKVLSVVQTIRGALEKVPVGNFVAIGFGAAIILVLKKLTDALNAFTAPVKGFTGVLNGLKAVFDNTGKLLQSFALRAKADAIFTIAKAIAVLAASLWLIAQIPQEKLAGAGIALGGIAIGIVAMAGALALIDKIGGISAGGTSLVALAGSLLILILAMKQIENLDPDKVASSVGLLGTLAAGMIGAMTLLSRFAPEMGKIGIPMLAFAGSMKIMVSALEQLGGINLAKAYAAAPLLLALMTTLGAITAMSSEAGFGSALSIVGAAIAVRLLVGTMKEIDKLEPAAIAKGIVVIGMMELLIVGIIAVTRLAGDSARDAGIAMLAFAGSMILMGIAIKSIAKLDEGDISKGLTVIAKVEALFVGVVAMTKLAGKNAKEAGVAMLAFSTAILILSGAIAMLAMIDDPAGLDRAVDAITQLGVVLSLVVASTKLASDAKSTILIIGIVLTLLSVALAGLSFIEPDRLQSATTAMSMIMAMFALVVASTGLAKKANSTIIIVGLVMAEMAVILTLISGLDPESSIGNALALSVLMGALSLVMIALSHVESVSASALKSLAVVGLIMGEVGLILAVLQELNVEPSLETAASLSILMLSLSAVILMLADGELSPDAILAAAIGAAAMITFVTMMGAFMVGLGALMEYVPGLEDLLNRGIPVLEKIGYALGNFFGSIIGGFIGGVGSGLEELADHLSGFALRLVPFMTTMKMFDDSTVSAVGSLATMILKLTAADLISGIASFLTGGASFENFGEKIVIFGKAMGDFSAQLKATPIDASAIQSAANAGQALADLNNSLPRSGGALQSFLGEKNFDKFSAALVPFALAMGMFSATLKANPIDADAIMQAANAGKALAELNNSLPATGGKLQSFLGEKNFDKFSASLVPFAQAMAKFSDVFEANPIDEASVQSAVNAGKMLSELQDSLPTTGGKIEEWFGGKMTLSEFGTQIELFGIAMVRFSHTIEGNINEDAVIMATNCGKILSELQNSLPDTGGTFAEWFGGDMNLSQFGEHIQTFGKAMVDFSTTVKDVDVGVVTKAVMLGQVLNTLQEALPENSGWLQNVFGGGQQSLSNFGAQLVLFGEDFATFATSLSTVNALQTAMAINSMGGMVELVKQLSDIDVSSLSSFSDTLKELAEMSLDGFIKVFEDAGPRVQTAVQTMLSTFLNAISTDPMAIATPFKTLVDNAETEIQNGIQNFTGLGSKLIESLMTGISMGNVAATVGISSVLNSITSYIASQNSTFRNEGMNSMTAYVSGIQSQREQILSAVRSILDAMLSAMNQRQTDFMVRGNTLMDAFRTGVEKTQPTIIIAVNSILAAMMTAMKAKYQEFYNTGAELIKYFAKGINAGQTISTTATSNVMNAVIAALKLRYMTFYNAGVYLVQGLSKGIQASSSLAVAAARDLASAVSNAVNVRLQIHSPSKVGEASGVYYGVGVTKGVLETTYLAEKAGEELGDAVNEGTEKSTEKAEETGQKIAQTTLDAVSAKIAENASLLGDAIRKILLGEIEDSTDDLDLDLDLDLDTDEDLDLDLDTETNPEDAADAVEDAVITAEDQAKKFGEIGEEAMNALIEGIKLGEQKLIESINALIDTIIATFDERKEEVTDKGDDLISGMITGNVKKVEDSVSSMMDKLKGAITGVGDDFTEASIELMTKFALGFDDQRDLVIQTVMDTIDTLLHKIKGEERAFYNAGVSIGKRIVDGIIAGIRAKENEALAAASALARALENLMNVNAQLQSEEKKNKELTSKSSSSSASSSSRSAAQTFSSSMSSASDTFMSKVSDDFNFSPTITPVLDLSDLERSLSTLDASLAARQTMTINANIESAFAAKENQNGTTEQVINNNYDFTQNNYSPKALSQIDIYRQTNNQFSAFKEVLNKA